MFASGKLTAAFLSLLCLVLMHGMPLMAYERVDHIYEAIIPIANRDESTQQEAIRIGFTKVLSKISGYSRTATFPELASEIEAARDYVSEFGLRRISLAAEDELSTIESDAMYMRFSAAQIDELLRRYELQVWPSRREEILFLVTTELGGNAQLLSPTSHPALFAYLSQIAFDRGFVLRVLDQNSLEHSGVSAEAIARLDQASLVDSLGSVSFDQIAIIRLDYSHSTVPSLLQPFAIEIEQTYGDLSVLARNFSYRADIEGVSFISAIGETIEGYIDELSLQTAFIASPQADSRISLRIEGIDSFESFRQTRDYIQNLEQVTSLTLLRVDADVAEFRLETYSGFDLLNASLVDSGFLISMNSELIGLSDNNALSYRYSQAFSRP